MRIVRAHVLGLLFLNLAYLPACSTDEAPAPAAITPVATASAAVPPPAPLREPPLPEPPLPEPMPKVELPPPPPPTCVEAELTDYLQRIEGVTNVAEKPCGAYVDAGSRCFTINFEQALDHLAGKSQGSFSQDINLIHRGCDLPTTVVDNGYALPPAFYPMEPTGLFGTNEVAIEHRFQGGSLPKKVADRKWQTLSIENGAADMHEVIAAFRKVYAKRWVSTGASKGGITAIYHRHLYPSDVNGTIAYVAPASDARQDIRYQAYLASTLPAACAEKVRGFQSGALTSRRAAFVADIAATLGQSPSVADYYLEYFTATYDWGFWQYGHDCTAVPALDAPEDVQLAYFQREFQALIQGQPTPGLPATRAQASDAALAYEWSWQQGFAAQVGAHVAPLLQTGANESVIPESQWKDTFPLVALPPYDGTVTQKARTWVRTTAENMLLIYGQFDPWSGGALDAPTKPSSGRYIVPGGNHGAQIADLPAMERQAALGLALAMLQSGSPKVVGALPVKFGPNVSRAHHAILEHERRQKAAVVSAHLRMFTK
jgi:PS-10 peptidase S37